MKKFIISLNNDNKLELIEVDLDGDSFGAEFTLLQDGCTKNFESSIVCENMEKAIEIYKDTLRNIVDEKIKELLNIKNNICL